MKDQMNSNELGKRLLTTSEAAAVLGIGKSTLDQDRLYGRIGLPFVRVGGRSIRYRREDLDAYLRNLKLFTSTSEPSDDGGGDEN